MRFNDSVVLRSSVSLEIKTHSIRLLSNRLLYHTWKWTTINKSRKLRIRHFSQLGKKQVWLVVKQFCRKKEKPAERSNAGKIGRCIRKVDQSRAWLNCTTAVRKQLLYVLTSSKAVEYVEGWWNRRAIRFVKRLSRGKIGCCCLESARTNDRTEDRA